MNEISPVPPRPADAAAPSKNGGLTPQTPDTTVSVRAAFGLDTDMNAGTVISVSRAWCGRAVLS